MEIFDVSVPIRERMPTWPGDPTVHLSLASAIADGAPANVSRIDFGVHTGTHVDAPGHFIDGAAGVDRVPLDALVGPCVVVEGLRVDAVPAGAERVLFRTGNGRLWEQDEFSDDFEKLDEAQARTLVERGVRLVGIDYLSIGDEAAHHVLLGARVVPVEGLDLRAVDPGEYLLLCLPLRIVGADGAPARTILIRE